jgi:tRNA (cytidine/uridine-2'-O-)-methyltransferase
VMHAKPGARPFRPTPFPGLPKNRKPIAGPAESMHLVLVEPEIPPNTGNVARLCAATGANLHLIEPFGFKLDDRQLKRAGMDYWQHVQWKPWRSWREFHDQLPTGARLWFIESGGLKHYAEVAYQPEDYLVFGRETAGLPKNLLECAALVLYEALRQQGFTGEI